MMVRPFGPERFDAVKDRVARLRVDPDSGFVQKDQRRIVDERGGEVQAALHAARVGHRAMGGTVFELHEPQRPTHACGEGCAAQTVNSAEEFEVFPAGQLVVHRERLRRDTDLPADGGVGGTPAASDGYPALIGREEAHGQIHRRALSGAVRPQQAEDLALPNLKREAVDSDKGAVALSNVFQDEHAGD